MKTIRVTLDFTMKVPDEWQIVGIERPPAGLIEIDGTWYEPGLMWLEVTDTDGDTYTSQQVDDDTSDMLMEHVTGCTETIDYD